MAEQLQFTTQDEMARGNAQTQLEKEQAALQVSQVLRSVEALLDTISDPELKAQIRNSIADIDSQVRQGSVRGSDILQLLQRAQALKDRTDAAVVMEGVTQIAAYNDMTDNVSAYPLSAAGQARVDAMWEGIQRGDTEAIARVWDQEIEKRLPKSMQAEAKQEQRDFLNSEPVKAAQRELSASPAGKEALSRGEKQQAMFEAAIEKESDEPKRNFLKRMHDSHADRMPSAAKVLQALQEGKSLPELEAAAAPAYNELETSMRHIVPTLLSKYPQQLNALMATLPPDEREKIMQGGDPAIAGYIRKLSENADPKVLAEAWELSERDPSKMRPEHQQAIALSTLQTTAGSSIAILGASQQMALMRKLEQRQDLSAQQQEQLQGIQKNFAVITDRAQPLLERAVTLVDGITEHTQNPLVAKGVAKTRESNIALATLTLSFTDMRGGLSEFDAMSRGAQSIPPDAAAVKYMADYQAYLGEKLIGEPVDMKDAASSQRAALALQTLGKMLLPTTNETGEQSAEMMVRSKADGSIEFIADDGGINYRVQQSAFTKEQSVVNTALSYQAVNRELLRDAIDGKLPKDEATRDRVLTAVYINAYGIYDSDEGRQMIDKINRMDTTPEELATLRDNAQKIITEDLQPKMQLAAPTVLQGLKAAYPERYEYIKNDPKLWDEKGNLLIGQVMGFSADAEQDYFIKHEQAMRNPTDAQLKALDAANPPEGEKSGYYKAQVMRDLGLQLQMVTTLNNLRDLQAAIQTDPVIGQINADGANLERLSNIGNSISDRVQAVEAILRRDEVLGTNPKLLASTATNIITFLDANPDFLTNGTITEATLAASREGSADTRPKPQTNAQLMDASIAQALRGVDMASLVGAVGKSMGTHNTEDPNTLTVKEIEERLTEKGYSAPDLANIELGGLVGILLGKDKISDVQNVTVAPTDVPPPTIGAAEPAQPAKGAAAGR